MKTILLAFLFSILTLPAFAYTEGAKLHHNDGTNVRAGTSCSLDISSSRFSVSHDGLCNIARNQNATAITTGDDTYLIIRNSDDQTEAEFYVLDGDRRIHVSHVYADGNCWKSNVVKFCAL